MSFKKKRNYNTVAVYVCFFLPSQTEQSPEFLKKEEIPVSKNGSNVELTFMLSFMSFFFSFPHVTSVVPFVM